MSLCVSVYCTLWSPAGKELTSWLLFVVSNCEFVTSPLVSLVRCRTWLYRFLIFAPLLTLLAVCFLLIQILNVTSVSEQWRTCSDATFFSASDLVSHCCPMSHKKDGRLICVKNTSLYLSSVVGKTGTLRVKHCFIDKLLCKRYYNKSICK